MFQVNDTVLYGGQSVCTIIEISRQNVASLIRTLYLHKEKQKQNGKKFHITDEQLFERAQKLLHEEIAFLLNIHPNDVPDFIEAQLQSDNIN